MTGNQIEPGLPPVQHTAEGKLRRVGVELEMNGLEIGELAKLTADFFGLQVEETSRYERTLKGDPAGDWVVELDFRLLKQLGREHRVADDIGDELKTSAEELLKWAADSLVPVELVSPPLPMGRLTEVNDLIVRLREAGAKGTADRMTNAFGMQFNPEVPSSNPETIAAYLKAFFCLFDWISARAKINMTRRLTAFAEPFPGAYIRHMVNPFYWPDLPTLIEDYLHHNPTRNRALDMLPLFKHLDADRVAAHTGDELIKSRPTFHYRLPDCRIDQPGWGLHIAWNDWLEVERLAADRERLDLCCRAYCAHLDHRLGRLLTRWVDQVESNWLSGAS
ncbi:Putative amidoligase enzyme [Halopseudomonas xinjiangensis]|uniref:Putative amidoligase enzyme n=1 Tax=Halopseudomonas xinjiangensis TaxID=487184 RepID=A0A1H1WFL5_9GAMM|nr:amidoligase family protein [Halopseudomonas xinjiangensis]SDS95835.1 Putative amidoligase enzyme [Halopseudomonas xinjiangensis]